MNNYLGQFILYQEMGKNKHNRGNSEVKPVKSGVTKNDKIVWIIILIVFIILICFVLLLQFLKYFIVL